MNGERIPVEILIEIARWALPFIVAYIAYRLGVKSQKIQGLREYITGIVKDNYPTLFNEIRRNSGLVDNYLENPFVNFDFSKLGEIWHKGFSGLMKTHHGDLFLLVASYRNNIRPRLRELHNLQVESRKKIFEIWENQLLKSGLGLKSGRIAQDLLTTINPFNVMPLLLSERYEEARNKIEECIMKRASPKKRKEINLEEISQSLIEKATSRITDFLSVYRKLKIQSDEEVKKKLLPLLQRYISNPI